MIVFSVLNRLDSDDPSNRVSGPVSPADARQRERAASKEELKAYRSAVRRDLEWLLNTRRIAEPLPDGMREVEESVYCYGLPDFSQLSLVSGRSEGDQDRLAAMIVKSIKLFEPRILDVRVTIAPRSGSGQELHFHVYGRLKMKPRPEQVCYDTVLDVTRGEYAVEVLGEGRA
jgi:type VI secretion system protein ImpF